MGVASIGLVTASSASAHDTASPVDQVAQLVEEVAPEVTSKQEFGQSGKGFLADTGTGTVQAPQHARDAIRIDGGQIELRLPLATGDAEAAIADDGSVVYAAPDGGVDAQITPHGDGFRVTTVIGSPDEDHSLDYQVSNSDLTLLDDGSISVTQQGILTDPDGSEIVENVEVARVAVPWAYDAAGQPVKTHYELTDSGFVQVVEPDAGTQYPIVADPDWWKVAKCAAAFLWLVGSTLFAVAKILRIKKYINALGGFQDAAELMIKASTWEERLRFGGSALVNLAAEISGIAAMRVCF